METPVESLPDDELLACANLQLTPPRRQEMIGLLEAHHERDLSTDERTRLDALMQGYRRDLVRKAQAIQVAIERGLLPPES